MLQYGVINKKIAQSQGFTLIELMIALVLGLLISAAVLQVYLSSFRTSLVQKSGSEIADASIFGIQNLERQIRLANLGNQVFQVNQHTNFGGVVLSPENIGLPADDDTVSKALMTRSAGDATGTGSQWTASSGTNIGSDQLTIQYRNVIGNNMVDCEGHAIALDDWAIERYFIRDDGVFACDAGRVDTAGGIKPADPATNTPSFGDAGVVFIDNVEQFKVLLGVQTKDGNNLGYISPKAYLELASSKPLYQAPIVAVKLGYLVRSNNVISEDTQSNYSIFGENNTVNDTSNFLRRNYESTIMLRNARVVTVP